MIPTTVGTAQGSILAPLEYLFYVNDMCNIITEGSVYQFADDTCLVIAHKDLKIAERSMQKNYDLLCKWAHDAGLVINASKTKVVHIRSSHNTYDIQPSIIAHEHQCFHTKNTNCNCISLEVVQQHKYLGLIIDQRFNWEPHVNHVCTKLRALLGKMAILKYKVPFNILRLIYMAMADSIIGYGLSSYGKTYKTHLEKIYKLQKSILKVIVPNKIMLEYKKNKINLFHYCKVLDIYDKLKLQTLIEEDCNKTFLKKKERPTRLRKLSYMPMYTLPRYNNTYGTRIWMYFLPDIVNELPNDLQNLYINSNIHKYKSKIKDFLVKNKTSRNCNILVNC
ncbi:hypothetical protein JYU34_010230 [Plutella xylostella]|uniref:Reverse transcriptase domain-containing protein n=1 Tax=Plutella xylostella TaxID=51655 RepID=A0ABQ7QHY5_PLUXY|nr:hypothetical protein JYU34_010230 [Plutella xylostella]